MKRARRAMAITVSAAAISALVLGGTALAQNLGVSDYAPESYIGFDAAAQAAVSNVGGVATKVELERENGVMLYEVTCITETGEREVDINAVTGETAAVRNEDGRNSNNQQNQTSPETQIRAVIRIRAETVRISARTRRCRRLLTAPE